LGRRIHRFHLEETFTLEKGNHFPLRPLHPPGLLFSRSLVVMAGYMKDTVKEKEAESFRKGYPLFIRFAPGRIRGNYHITEKMGVYTGEIPFSHGKREDIGGFVDSAILTVETAHGPVAHKGHGKLAIGESQGA